MKTARHVLFWLRDRPWLATMFWVIPAALLPAVPIDETRYLSIAWEMRRSGNAIGLTLNGHPYMDKSPLLFWLINVAWTLLGVSTLAARAVSIAFAAASVATVTAMARQFGLNDPASAGWILLPFVLFGAFAPVAMFDLPLVCFVALGMLGLVWWVKGRRVHGVLLFLVAAIFGLLAKGPVYLLHLLGPMVLLRWWHGRPIERPWRFTAGITGCLALAGVPLALWAITNAARFPDVPMLHTLSHQSVGRVAHSFAHKRPVAWYLPWILPFLLPWSFLLKWRGVRTNLACAIGSGEGRLGVAATVPAFIAFSFISGKQIHYLLPLLPGAALLGAAMVEHGVTPFSFGRVRLLLAAVALAWAWPVANAAVGMPGNATWYIAALATSALLGLGALATRGFASRAEGGQLRTAAFAGLMAVVALVLLVGVHVKAHMDPSELADTVKELQRRGVAVAAVGDEPGMVTYLARLPRPLPRITENAAWVHANPEGRALVHASQGAPPAFVESPILLADGWEGLVPAPHLNEVHP
ncbi:ArnT family glycosyltransferase [Luteibacter aegosomatissinici]|uniref:ArnT family glycosyltransferase n=1 Tax=Luteibacter aegosomatissinici TaxID=2911539 RepID=UPI001FF7FB00|nr:glycosyltransferase family 39 protein [Luteibacter aegosomatissinici]UPG96292.1 glycosyltransferase family 39 protein [Luteibacter aegosomatissinici]